MIPADSRYCDICGVEILECVNCGAIGSDPFCPECGKPMIARKPDSRPSEQEHGEVGDAGAPDKTIGRRRSGDLVLKARDGGFVLKPEHEAVIGREDSPYSSMLRSLNLISRRHGKFIRRADGWQIVDFGSTNGTYVNNVELRPDRPVSFSEGGVVDIGTYLFEVVRQ